LPEQPILAARTAARTGQFWQPELYPELPSSGSQNSSQSCCSGQNCAAKIGSTVQAELGSSGRKTSQNWPENCPELVSFGCKNQPVLARTCTADTATVLPEQKCSGSKRAAARYLAVQV